MTSGAMTKESSMFQGLVLGFEGNHHLPTHSYVDFLELKLQASQYFLKLGTLQLQPS